jgi:hypothetical protein
MAINIENADTYFIQRLGAENWFELEDEQKQAAINTACNIIKRLPFIGQKLTPTQVDIFPRSYRGQVIPLPVDVESAIYEEAFSLVNSAELNSAEIPDGVQSLSLGGASISFKDGSGSLTDSVSKNSMKFLDGWIKKGFDIEPEKFREVY